jgi:hypothetical protein
MSLVRLLPAWLHAVADYAVGGLTAFYIVAGIAVLEVSLITNYQYSPRREWVAGNVAA